MSELVHAVTKMEAAAAKGRPQCWMGVLYANPHALGAHPDCLMCEFARKGKAS